MSQNRPGVPLQLDWGSRDKALEGALQAHMRGGVISTLDPLDVVAQGLGLANEFLGCRR